MTLHLIETDDGAGLRVEEGGVGPAVFLVKGAFCSLRQWDRVVSDLAGSFRLIRHDVRGSGCSRGGAAEANTFAHPDRMPFVARVKMSVLVATGEHDPNLASSRRALAGLEDGCLEVLAHTGHGSVLQRPDLVAKTVMPFLGGEPAGSGAGPRVQPG